MVNRVDVRGGLVIEGMEEEAFLQRGERQDFFEIGVERFQSFDLLLCEVDQREVRRRVSRVPGFGGLDMADQRFKSPPPIFGQGLYIVLVQMTVGPSPGRAEAGPLRAVESDGVDGEQVLQRHLRIAFGIVPRSPRSLGGESVPDS